MNARTELRPFSILDVPHLFSAARAPRDCLHRAVAIESKQSKVFSIPTSLQPSERRRRIHRIGTVDPDGPSLYAHRHFSQDMRIVR